MSMNVDIRHIRVCALCTFWNDPCQNHVKPSNIPYHYTYEPRAREKCLYHRYDTYGGQPGCTNYECKFRK